MEKVVAILWDCDNTLVDGYLQNPIFEHYGINPGAFWGSVFSIPARSPEVKFDPETTYINYYLDCIENGTTPGLNNALLREMGAKATFFPGVPSVLARLKAKAAEMGIRLEHHLVFTGFAESVKGSALMPDLDGYWGCELTEGPGPDGTPVLRQAAYTLDNVTKARAIFEIHAGIDSHDPKKQHEPVEYHDMIYVTDGPGDEHMLRRIADLGGCAISVWADPNPQAGRGPGSQETAQKLQNEGLVEACCKADYTDEGEAFNWLVCKLGYLAVGK